MNRGVKLFLILGIVSLLAFPFVSAVNTEIKIKTLPYHEVQLTIAKASTSYTTLASYRNQSDEYGDFVINYPAEVSAFDLYVYIKKNGVRVAKDISIGHIAGEDIYLEIAPEGFTFIETPTVENLSDNQTIENNHTETENSTEIKEENQTEEQTDSTPITGNVIFGNESFISKSLIYYSLGVFAILLVILLTAKTTKYIVTRKKRDGFESDKPKEIKVKKLSELQKEKKERIEDYKDVIEDAEKKIKEAQEEIKKLKERGEVSEKQRKIDAAKKKLVEDQKELMRLREELKDDKD